jgi:hypothetical protein
VQIQTQEAEETETGAEEELHCICIGRWPERYEREYQIKENSEATKSTKNNKKGSMQEALGVHACVRAGVGVVVGWLVERRV